MHKGKVYDCLSCIMVVVGSSAKTDIDCSLLFLRLDMGDHLHAAFILGSIHNRNAGGRHVADYLRFSFDINLPGRINVAFNLALYRDVPGTDFSIDSSTFFDDKIFVPDVNVTLKLPLDDEIFAAFQLGLNIDRWS